MLEDLAGVELRNLITFLGLMFVGILHHSLSDFPLPFNGPEARGDLSSSAMPEIPNLGDDAFRSLPVLGLSYFFNFQQLILFLKLG